MSEKTSVLIVDDTENNLVTMHAVLERPELNILKASSGIEALELLLKHEVALAIIDVNMPKMDGFELAELIRGNPRTQIIPLIFITASLHEPARTFRGYQAGAVDFMNKPFDPQILVSKVNVFVELYSQRKQLASQLTALQNALQLNEMYHAVLGHDLRTPLSAVLTGAQLIAKISDQSKVTTVAARIQSSAQRMNTMVNQLLELARARSNDIKLDLAKNDYRIVCEQIVEEFIDPHAARAITLEHEADTVGIFDKARFSQILSNLIGNAIQHGVPDMPVHVSIDGSDRERVVIRVRNHGHIPADQIARIFEPYHSSQAHGSNPGGLGLGLFIVRQMAHAHGGKVTVDSTPEEGTIFDISMPRSGSSKTDPAILQ